MALSKLTIPPDQQGYGLQLGSGVVSAFYDGGASRYRAGLRSDVAKIDVAWTVGPSGYAVLRAFHRNIARFGAPFLVDLILDTPGLTEYTAHFLPGTFGLKSLEGSRHVVGAQLEVEPTPPPDGYAALMVDAYDPATDDFGGWNFPMGALETLVNTDIPAASW